MRLFKKPVLLYSSTDANLAFVQVQGENGAVWYMDLGLFVHFLTLNQIEDNKVVLEIEEGGEHFQGVPKYFWTRRVVQMEFSAALHTENLPDADILRYGSQSLLNIAMPTYIQNSLRDFNIEFDMSECKLNYTYTKETMTEKDEEYIYQFSLDSLYLNHRKPDIVNESDYDGLHLLSEMVEIMRGQRLDPDCAFRLGELAGKLHGILLAKGDGRL